MPSLSVGDAAVSRCRQQCALQHSCQPHNCWFQRAVEEKVDEERHFTKVENRTCRKEYTKMCPVEKVDRSHVIRHTSITTRDIAGESYSQACCAFQKKRHQRISTMFWDGSFPHMPPIITTIMPNTVNTP